MRITVRKQWLKCLSSLAFALVVCLSEQIEAQTPCSCTNCPLPLPEGFSGDALLQVSGATNNTLGQNGQGVCGVKIAFEHQYVGDLRISLISPAGQEIQLLGDVGFFGNTDFTTWNVTFLPCSVTPMPDSPFPDQWQNSNAWGFFGNYDGSYHPYQGCLESFNTGPVNGTWRLHIEDLLPPDTGIINSWSLVFCDTTGINCFSCAAQAGDLLQPDITACQTNAALAFSATPTYATGVQIPPASQYGYAYVVTNSAGVITQVQSSPDLTGASPGSYTVCGLSYLNTQAAALPIPNGSLTLNQLNVALQSTNPPFCGDLTSNCIQVQINPPPPDSTLTVRICQGDSLTFFGTRYGSPGTYTRTVTQGNCSFQATLNLQILQPVRDSVAEIVCQGSCSTYPGFTGICTPGIYFDTLYSVVGCDSVYRKFELIVLNLQGLTTSPTIPLVSCGNAATVTAQATATFAGSVVQYQWFAAGNQVPLQSGAQFSTLNPGNYLLRACETYLNRTCCDTVAFAVGLGTGIPATPTDVVIPQPVCVGDTVTILTTAIPNASNYVWQFPAGFTRLPAPSDTQLVLIVTAAGNHPICLSVSNTCGASQQYCESMLVRPAVPAPVITGLQLACAGLSTYYAANLSGAVQHAFWEVQQGPGVPIYFVEKDSFQVFWPANMTNGRVCLSYVSFCSDTLRTCLTVNTSAAVPTTAPTLTANIDTTCFGGSIALSVPTAATGLQYGWTYPAALVPVGGSVNSQVLLANTVGTYEVCAWYYNGCGRSDTSCRNITFLDNQPPDAGPDIISQCDTVVQLQGSGPTAVWSIGSGPAGAVVANPNLPNSQFRGPAGNYLLLRTSGAGSCLRTDSTFVTLKQPLAITSVQPSCQPGDSTYQVEVNWSGGSPPYQLNGSPPLGGQSGIAGPFASGSTGVIVVLDQNGCTDTAFTSINCICNNSPGTFSQNQVAGCAGSEITVPYNNDANPASGQLVHFVVGATTSSIWNGGLLAQYSTSTIPFNPNLYSPNTTYYLWCVVANKGVNGTIDFNDPCISVSQPVQIQWISLPTLQLTGPTASCFGFPDSISFVLTPFSVVYPLTGVLSNSTGVVQTFNINTPNPITITENEAGNGWYFISSFQMAGTPGCQATEFDSVFVAPVQYDQAVVADSLTVCNSPGSIVNFSNLVFTGNVNGFWSGPVGTGTFTQRNMEGVAAGVYPFVFNHPPNPPCPPGNDTCWVRVEDCTCPPLNVVPSVGPICQTNVQQVNLSQYLILASSGSFSLTGAPAGANVVVANQVANFINALPGNYIFTYTLTDPVAGCPAQANLTYTISAAPQEAGAPLSDTLSFCIDTLIVFNSNLQGASPGGRWKYLGTANIPGIHLIESAGACSTMSLPVGHHPFAYIQNGTAPCPSDTAVFVVTIRLSPSANAGSDQLIDCAMSSAVLDGSGSSPAGGISYTWVSAQTSMTLGASVTQEVFAAGDYILIVTDAVLGCSDRDTVTVTTDGSLPVGELAITGGGCNTQSNGTVTLTQVQGGTPPYQVVFDGVLQSVNVFSGLSAGLHTIEITDVQGCVWTNDQVFVPSGGAVQVSLGDDVEIFLGDSVVVNAQVATQVGIDTLLWSVIGVDSLALALSQTYKPNAALRVRLTVFDSLGCSGYDDILISVRRLGEVVVPNVFTPGSSQNNVVTVLGASDVEEVELWSVFDRWGNLVYRAAGFAPGDYRFGWNGQFRGKPVQQGVYVYSVRYRMRDGQIQVQHGDITVVR